MRIRLTGVLAGLAICGMAAPLWAGPRTESAELDLLEPATVSGTQLQPGTYELKVVENGNQLMVQKNGKTIAEVPCHWIQLSQKATETQIIMTDRVVHEIDFHGRTAAVQFN